MGGAVITDLMISASSNRDVFISGVKSDSVFIVPDFAEVEMGKSSVQKCGVSLNLQLRATFSAVWG
jgi:hypothetical protein